MPQYLVSKLGADRVEFMDGAGTSIRVGRKDVIDNYQTTLEAAKARAVSLATSNPGVQYAVFGIVGIFETTTPKVIEKEVNEAGEIVIKESGNV